MSRRTKLGLSILLVIIAIAVVSFLLYFTLFAKSAYKICAVDLSEIKVENLRESELQLYENGTFHLQITHQEQGLIFLGIGTYTQDNAQCVLTFEQAIGRQNDTLSNQMNHFNAPFVCVKSGNRLKFVDQNNQVYYFG